MLGNETMSTIEEHALDYFEIGFGHTELVGMMRNRSTNKLVIEVAYKILG